MTEGRRPYMPSNFAAEIDAVKTASSSYLPSMRKAKWATCRRPKLAYIYFFYRLFFIMPNMKKYIALIFALGFFAVLPSAVADDGKLAVDAPAHVRLPHNHNDNHNIILTLRVNNIQVKEDWRVTSSSPLNLQISNGVLSIDEPLTVTQIVATVIVQDLFSDLNQAYKNLSVQAVISIEIVYDVVLADAPHLRALVGQTGLLHTFAATGEPTGYSIVAGNQTYFSLDNNGDLSLLAGIVVGFYTLTVEVSDDDSNSDQAVATVQIFPALSLSDAPFLRISIIENAVNVHTFTASGGVGDKTYTVIVAPAHSSYFSLGVTSGVLSVAANTPDGLYTLTVQAADEDNNTIQAVATVQIFPALSLSDAPRLSIVVSENAVSLHTFTASGGVGDKTYTVIVAPAHSSYFSLGVTSGVLSAAANAPDGLYTLTVRAADEDNNTIQAVATVQIFPALSLSDAPRLSLLISEHAVSLHTFTASGGIGDKTYTVIVAPAHSSYFSLGVTSGVLSAVANAPAGFYLLTVRAVDEDNNALQVVAMVEILPFVSLPASTLYALEGKAALHTLVGVGGLGAKTYALVSGSNYFTLSNGGVLTVSGDAEVGEYALVIEVSDSAANKATTTVMVEVSSQGQFFVLGGFEPKYIEAAGGIVPSSTDGVWSSADGNAWVGENDASWSARGAHQAIVHNGIIYVLGGNASAFGSRQSDVWSSADGKAWARETPNAWSSRGYHQAVSHHGKMYVLGGEGNGGTQYSDVWSSTDGKEWTEETANAGWEARESHQVVSYNGRMYLLGGLANTTNKNDVWSSTDGKTWSLETNNADWTARNRHRAVVHQGKMYVLGGSDGNHLHDVWSSADGKTWMEEKANAGWGIRSRFAALSFSNTLYVLGGDADDPNYYDDIWSSADGKAWGQIGALPLTLYDHQAIIFPPPLALLGVGKVLTLTAGIAESELHTFKSEYGQGQYTYSLSAEGGFAVSNNGVLSADASTTAGIYTLMVWVFDEVGNRAQTAVKVLVVAGASSFAIHSGIFPIFSPSALVGGVRGRVANSRGV